MFSQLITAVWKESMSPENIQAGFIATGIYPVDKTKFPPHLFGPVGLKEYKARLSLDTTERVLSDQNSLTSGTPQRAGIDSDNHNTVLQFQNTGCLKKN